MAEIIKMPKLSDTMEEGVVAKWHKNIGDKIEDGELLAEIETDKATMEYESFQEGVILYHGVKEGEAAAVDSILAIVGKQGEDISAMINNSSKNIKEETKPITEAKNDAVAAKKADTSKIAAKIIKMPKLSDTMKEGTVAKWTKKVGDKVESGEILAEIETDKATMEFESFEDGILLYQGLGEGESAAVDTILAIIGEKNADFQALIDSYQVEVNHVDEEAQSEEVAKSESTKADSGSEPVKSNVVNSGGRVKISPLALRLANEKNIDINSIQGTGDGGRIIKRDIENYQPSSKTTPTASASTIGVEDYTEFPISQMRKTIAKRLSESKFTAPHFYLTIDINMEQAIAARKAINAIPDVKISFNDLVIKAAAVALKKHPNVNSSWLGDKIRTNKHVNIGVAVAVDEGLLVPVVRYADTKQLSHISSEVKDFAQRAKDKKLQPQDWEGSTFSISNLGMFGIEEFTAIVNPPNACILAIGTIRQTPIVKDGQIVVGNMMKVTLSCDHRVVDGASGSEFLQSFKTFIENPVTILG
ncbi:MAG: pyruvate dehydrogenase complex dihydrolipoamide acetyltransferase [Bacteroidetes bacterium]|nr:MAG: pyruvate dehydrogenase complex dihydrolipoamide acetyltransferase [Bacteroidota bacterium]MBL1144046.1 pyruvate dehydrogenase complex dihydrolipoamide acetyltransferase [Bacteroidota bacterium]NOG56846.1 pyruvate dehydrogenase complex dihydrolipoamide acetyltransferase [Bacteroidota bacterium]